MLTASQAELLAQTRMQEYVNACGCETRQHVADALMKMASMCGLGMCAVVGMDEAVARLQGTTDYIATTQAGVNWRSERAN